MNKFLKYVAQDILNTFGTNLQNVVVVFPNKRANLFLNEHLATIADQPLWAPSYKSISDLFRDLSSARVGEHILLVCLLYQCYLQVTGKTEADESLDQFYNWGEILLSDFDDADKNMVNIEKLFRNLKELKELDADTRAYLSEEQQQVLNEFFFKFRFDETELQKRFTNLWNVLGQLYDNFNARLDLMGLRYEGAMYREVVEHLQPEALTAKCYLFVGFNVLNKVEESLFRQLQQLGKARFYWDYDTYYLSPESNEYPMEAGRFLAHNLKQFGNALPKEFFESMKQPKTVEYVSAPTESAQVNHVYSWLKENQTPVPKDTAIVLCNESLLEPVLHVLTSTSINITMGFPLADTPIAGFVQALCNNYHEGYSVANNSYRLNQIARILQHPYTRLLTADSDELLQTLKEKRHFLAKPQELHLNAIYQMLFPDQLCDISPLDYIHPLILLLAQKWEEQKQQTDALYRPLYQEALFKVHTLCTQLQNLTQDGLLIISPKTLNRFLLQLISSQSIPFHGEPAIGLQVMGVLETRNLDFDHLIMLSVNEGMLPKSGAEASFIPYNLRKAFGMTLIEQKIAVYAYYFYRLIQRASRITLMYNNNTQGLQKGEMSRFMLQYLVEHPENHTISQKSLTSAISTPSPQVISIPKSESMVRQMLESNRRYALSPSALNRYINCPLQYYFQYVAHLAVKEEVTDEITNALFGTMFHRCCELVYGHLMQLRHGTILESHIDDALQNDAELLATVRFVLKEHLFLVAAESELKENSPEYMDFIKQAPMPVLNGTQTIVQSVLHKYLRKLLEYDRQLTPFTILGLEKRVKSQYPIQLNGETVNIRIGGSIDRLDEYTSPEGVRTIRVVDYKTSDSAQTAKSMAELFDSSKASRAYHIMQAMYYTIQVNDNGLNPHHEALSPALFYISQSNPDYHPEVKIGGESIIDFAQQAEKDYREQLTAVLQELYSTNVPFHQAPTNHHCANCDFKAICGKS